MSLLSYCKGWFRAKKLPLASYTTEQARARHESGEIYYALIGSSEAPLAFMEIVKGMVGVSFLDERLRENLIYSFQEREPGRLFLTRATWREFIGSSDEVANGTTYMFEPRGGVIIHSETFVPSQSRAYFESHANLGGNWNKTPSFGQYSGLLRTCTQWFSGDP